MIIYAENALADLKRLRAFLQAKDLRLLARFADAIVKSDAQIAKRPLSHPLVSDGETRKRLLRFGRSVYVFYFRVEGENQIILRVWHGRERRA